MTKKKQPTGLSKQKSTASVKKKGSLQKSINDIQKKSSKQIITIKARKETISGLSKVKSG